MTNTFIHFSSICLYFRNVHPTAAYNVYGKLSFIAGHAFTTSAVLTYRHNYKDYSMESRTQFRVHAALAKLKADPGEDDDTHL